MPTEQLLPTIGSIAERFRQPLHRVRYIIDTRRIQATRRAGNARVFSETDVEFIRQELARIDRQLGERHG